MKTFARASRALVVLAATGAFVLAAAAPASAETLPPAYYPVGPQTNVDQADLEGWTLCFSQGYDDGAELYGPGGILDELCTGDYLLLAGGPLDDATLAVLAAAPRADVLTDTTTDLTTTHNANGSEWYFNDDHSWGFALGGDPVFKDSCDTNFTDNPDLRLCWHTGAEAVSSGYRAGDNELFGSDWTRYIYQSDGTEAPALAATGVDTAAPLVLAGGLLAAGLLAVVVTAAVRRRSTI